MGNGGVMHYLMMRNLLSMRRTGILIILMLVTSINDFAQSLYVGESEYLETPDIPYDGYVTHAWWSCTNPNIEFSEADEVGAIVKPIHYFEGQATIECTYAYTYWGYDDNKHVGSGTTYFYIRCIPNYATVSQTDIKLNIGESHRLSYTLEKYCNTKGEWNSSNEDVVTVDSKGMVKAIGPGKARIELDPIVGPLVYCDVEVEKINPTSISIPSSLTIYVGERRTLTPTLYPSYATSNLQWFSKDENIATVSSGEVMGMDEGYTIIYAKTDNGLTSNECKVNVYYREADSFTLNNTSLTLPVEDSQQLEYSFTPSNAKVLVTWFSNNPSVASVSNDGMLKALSVGEVIITATTNNGITSKCTVKVLPLPTRISLPKTLILASDDSYKLDVKAYPSDSYLNLEWSSSDKSVATVSTEGVIEGVGMGHTTITATASNGVSISCDVEVIKPVYFLNLWLYDGSCFIYPFSEHPIIQSEKNTTIVKTEIETVEYNTLDVCKYTLSKVESVVDEYHETVSTEKMLMNNPRFCLKQDYIILSQCAADMLVELYSANGGLIGMYKTDLSGYLAIPTYSLAKGIYVIKSKSVTYKIVKR